MPQLNINKTTRSKTHNMSFPNHPKKYDSPPIITPHKRTEYREEMGADDIEVMPKAVVLCYSSGLMDYFTDTYDGQCVEGGYVGDLYAFEECDYAVGVLGNFGVGAPVTAMLMEELIGDGVESFLSIGFSGGLDDTVEIGEYIICEKAIRDEGTSYHYTGPEKYAYPSEPFVEWLQEALRTRQNQVHVGPSWTIDAIYRETEAEVEQYAEEGVLTIDMEASAVFTIASHHGVDAAALFIISDYLGPTEWEPRFHLTREDMEGLGDTAKELLTDYVA